LLLLETGMLGCFAARDIILFYVFFEFTLIPLFFLIGIWGSEERRYAAIKFFLYTLAGSMLTFLGLLAIVLWVYDQTGREQMTFSIVKLVAALGEHPLPLKLQIPLFLALFAGFAIKVPLFPLHTWLPLAHVQAPTAGSVILAGILLKIGTYGFLRFSLPMLPDATVTFMPCVLVLSGTGIIYGAMVALAQGDMKRLIAYSSVSHLGYCMLGIFALNKLGMQGGALQMINHGLSTGGLFACIGMVYERYHTRQIADLGGLAKRTPMLAVCMLLFTFSSIGLPGLNGFAGEFLILTGMFQRAWSDAPVIYQATWMTIAVAGVFGVVLGAWYMLWLVERVFFGPLKEPGGHAPAPVAHGHGSHDHHGHAAAHDDHSSIHDLNLREAVALIPLIVFMFWIGLVPQTFLAPMAPELDKVEAIVAKAYKSHDWTSVAKQADPLNHRDTEDAEKKVVRVVEQIPERGGE
jgi:NADH-quinone oxidoreductase subunit M